MPGLPEAVSHCGWHCPQAVPAAARTITHVALIFMDGLPRTPLESVRTSSLRRSRAASRQIRPDQGQPEANAFRKHEKSATFSTGGVVDPSQFAYGSAA